MNSESIGKAVRFGRVVVAIALAVPAAASAGGTTLQARSDQALGEYITDGAGMTLYLFEKDEDGRSHCYDACANAWPPLIAGNDVSVRGMLDPDKLSAVERKDGAMQVTYGGWPLYYFVKDKRAGDTRGQEVEGFGAEWYVVSPAGMKAEDEEHDDEDHDDEDQGYKY